MHVKGSAVTAGKVYRGPSFAEHVYTAVPGDTLASIAQRFGVSVASLRAENEFSKHVVSAQAGQKIYLPDGYRDRNAPAEEHFARAYPPPGLVVTRRYPAAVAPAALYPVAGRGRAQRSAASAPDARVSIDAQISQMGGGRFQWPMRGTVLSRLPGSGPAASNNDGRQYPGRRGIPGPGAAAPMARWPMPAIKCPASATLC